MKEIVAIRREIKGREEGEGKGTGKRRVERKGEQMLIVYVSK